ncbi:MAG: hypothetical protein EBS61_05195 [Betaproteobacteria bacterium]|nr:hypothetical protein [Betaproteobacteria bacterium]
MVGVEPSCLLTMRDELLSMRLNEHHHRLAKLLAKRALLLEEYLDQELQAGRIRLALQPMQGRHVLLHGHCHQKAFDALSPAVRLLSRIPGLLRFQRRWQRRHCCLRFARRGQKT